MLLCKKDFAITVRSDQQAPKGWLLLANEQECALTALTFLLQASEKQAVQRLQFATKARICDQNLSYLAVMFPRIKFIGMISSRLGDLPSPHIHRPVD